MSRTGTSIATHAPATLAGLARCALTDLSARLPRRLRAMLPLSALPRVRGVAMPVRLPARPHVADAEAIYRGVFAFAGTRVECAGDIVFDLPGGGPAWRRSLHGFSWLADLLAGDRQLWRIQARALLADWYERRRVLPAEAREPAVIAERATMLVALAPALLAGAPAAFETLLYRLLAAEFRRLLRALATARWPHERLLVLIAAAGAALSLKGLEGQREQMLARLAAELAVQILPDGGHVSRSPALLLEIVARLQPLREALAEARMPVPAELDAALERALPMLRFHRHGDGGLALFNGVADPAAGQLTAVLDADVTMGAPLSHAPHVGYARLVGGEAVLQADVGHPAAGGTNPDAALSTLAIEFSHGAHRIITGCGAPRLPSSDWRSATRRTVAHSAPTLNDRDAGGLHIGRLAHMLLGAGTVTGPAHVQAEVTRIDRGMVLEAAHDAWARYGLRCSRRLFLSADGHDLRGEDRLEPLPGVAVRAVGEPFCVRFHLHPGVKASPARDGASVILALPDRSAWRFAVRGAALSVEESVYLAAETGLRRTRQIVLRAPLDENGAVIAWSLKRQRVERATRRSGREASSPRLPLEA